LLPWLPVTLAVLPLLLLLNRDELRGNDQSPPDEIPESRSSLDSVERRPLWCW
jgi:hypothetical protein